MSTTYIYWVDLNERGVFRARVIDEHDNTIHTVTSARSCNDLPEEESCYAGLSGEFDCTCGIEGEPWQVEAGYMKHTGDVDGLTEYLRDLQIIGKDADIMHERDVPARMARL